MNGAAVLDLRLPQPAVQELLAGVLLVGARPLDPAELLEPRVAHAAVCIGDRPRSSFQTSSARGAAPVDAEAPAELAEDRDVVARLAGRVERLAHPLHAPLAAT